MENNQTRPTEWRAWADGSSLSNPGCAGWAILVKRPDGTGYTVHGNSGSETRTNNQAEMFALLQAVKAMPKDQPSIIFSDSNHAIRSATTWRATWVKNGMKTSKRKPVEHQGLVRRLWEVLDERPMVLLEWVPGHSGIDGNEAVDLLSRRAAEAAKAGKSIVRKRRELPAP